MDKHVLYTTSDKTFTYANNKVQYSMASMDKEPTTVVHEAEKADLYDTLDKLDLYSCGKCNKSFRKQKQCEAHIKEAHSNMKVCFIYLTIFVLWVSYANYNIGYSELILFIEKKKVERTDYN